MFTKLDNFVIIIRGDMMEYTNMELFYDVMEESISTLYELNKRSYFDLFFESVKNILESDLTTHYDEEADAKLLRIYSRLSDKDFTPEDIRKALQSIIIRGLNEEHEVQDVTPDTIGFLMAYLISRLHQGREVSILDPLAGTGNMLLSIESHLNMNVSLFAIENSKLKINILKSMADLCQTIVEIYFQDTLNIKMKDMDFVVFDIPTSYTLDPYFPYYLVLHHLESLKDDGYMIGLLPNDFFEHDNDMMFKEGLSKIGRVYGIIELPDSFFKSSPKSIIIFKKNTLKDKNCLMVKLPTFDDEGAFDNVLQQIEDWFLKNKNN